MKNNDEFHRDLAMDRNKKRIVHVWIVQALPSLACVFGLPELPYSGSAEQPLPKGDMGSSFSSLFVYVGMYVWFSLNLKSEKEKQVSNIHNPTT